MMKCDIVGDDMYEIKDVCAVIVSYNCDGVILDNIDSLLKQTGHILVLDNGSCEESKKHIEGYKDKENVTAIYHKTNEGIAKRLNEALAWAEENGYPLLLTMDQDTILDENCVIQMLKVMNREPRCASVGPNRKGNRIKKSREVSYLITSGNLVNIKFAQQAGGYYSDLFIDLVDIEFSLALRRAGFLLYVADKAFMKHKVGEYETNRVLGSEIKYLSHSPKRFYYIYRNHTIIVREYFSQYPAFCTKILLLLAVDTGKLLFEANKGEKLCMLKRGLRDGRNKTFNR